MYIQIFLKKAFKEKKIVSLYCDQYDWSHCSTGLINYISETHVAIDSLNRYGEIFGQEIRKISDIFKIDCDGKYEKKLEKLLKTKNNKNNKNNKIIIDYKKNGLINSALFFSKTKKAVISLWMKGNESSISGIALSLDVEWILISLIDEYGENDGEAILKLEDIDHVDISTNHEKSLDYLYKTNYRLKNN